jgi:hypothetical protein
MRFAEAHQPRAAADRPCGSGHQHVGARRGHRAAHRQARGGDEEAGGVRDFARGRAPASTFKLHVRIGDVVQNVFQLALDYDVELIVVGTHGHSAVSRLAFGSVAQKIVEAARCPVLIAAPRDFSGMEPDAHPRPPAPVARAPARRGGHSRASPGARDSLGGMAVEGKKTKPERVQTDESLRTERAKTDRELARQQDGHRGGRRRRHRPREGERGRRPRHGARQGGSTHRAGRGARRRTGDHGGRGARARRRGPQGRAGRRGRGPAPGARGERQRCAGTPVPCAARNSS